MLLILNKNIDEIFNLQEIRNFDILNLQLSDIVKSIHTDWIFRYKRW